MQRVKMANSDVCRSKVICACGWLAGYGVLRTGTTNSVLYGTWRISVSIRSLGPCQKSRGTRTPGVLVSLLDLRLVPGT